VDFLLKLEESGLSKWVRESDSLLAYPGILLLHTIGMGLVVGINAMLDFRILGFARGIRIPSLQRFFPIMWVGFWLNAITGTILLASNARRMTSNPDFWVKLAFISLAVITVMMLKKRVFGSDVNDTLPLPTQTKVLAVTSLLFWLGAIIAGRLLAYVGISRGVF